MVHASLGDGFQQLVESGRSDPFELYEWTAVKIIRERAPGFGFDLLELALSQFVVDSEPPVLGGRENIVPHYRYFFYQVNYGRGLMIIAGNL